MQSQTGAVISEQGTIGSERTQRSFILYAEYSKNHITEIIRARRSTYEMASRQKKRELEREVEGEINDFREWLADMKGIEPEMAHYYAISMKSLLLGLPCGAQIAQLFNIVLDGTSRH
jgi:hypothetical protein